MKTRIIWTYVAMICFIEPLNCLAQPKTATAAFSQLSIQLSIMTRPDLENVAVTTYFTTFDGESDYPLSQNADGGLLLFSQELRPRIGQLGVYETDYVEVISTGYLEYGSMTMNLPTADTDQNGVPDVVQSDTGVNTDFTGTMQADTPKATTSGLTGHMFRSVNSELGTIWYKTSSSTQINRGTFSVGSTIGTVTYSRGTTNVLSLQFSFQSSQTGNTATNTGTTSFTVNNANQISLPQFFLDQSDNTIRTVNPSVLNRSGNRYLGTLEMADGLLVTPWRDFARIAIAVTDANDADANGIPDLSDALVIPPVFLAHPKSQIAAPGADVTFNAVAEGSAKLIYQWKFNGADLSGETNANLTLRKVQTANVGAYTVEVRNAVGSLLSAAATLELAAPEQVKMSAQKPRLGEFSLSVTGPVGRAISIYGSSDLVAWTFLRELPNTTGRVAFSEPMSQRGKHQFYKAALR